MQIETNTTESTKDQTNNAAGREEDIQIPYSADQQQPVPNVPVFY